MNIKLKILSFLWIIIFSSLLFVPGLSAGDHFTDGNSWYIKGEFEKAVQSYTKAIKVNSNDAESRNNRGCALSKLGKFDDAIADFTWGIDKNVEDNTKFYFHFNRALVYLESGNMINVQKDLDAAVKIDYKKVDRLKESMELALITKRNNKDKTDINIQEAIKYHDRGIELLRGKKYGEAITQFNKAIELDPKYAEAYYSRAISYLVLKKPRSALEDVNKTIELLESHGSPKAIYYIFRATCLERLELYDQALNDLNQATQIDPESSMAYSHRADIYTEFGKFEKALTDYSKAIHLEPSNYSHYFSRGVLFQNMKRHQEAIDDFNSAEILSPNNAIIYIFRAESYAALNQKDHTCSDARKACKLGNCTLLNKNPRCRDY